MLKISQASTTNTNKHLLLVCRMGTLFALVIRTQTLCTRTSIIHNICSSFVWRHWLYVCNYSAVNPVTQTMIQSQSLDTSIKHTFRFSSDFSTHWHTFMYIYWHSIILHRNLYSSTENTVLGPQIMKPLLHMNTHHLIPIIHILG